MPQFINDTMGLSSLRVAVLHFRRTATLTCTSCDPRRVCHAEEPARRCSTSLLEIDSQRSLTCTSRAPATPDGASPHRRVASPDESARRPKASGPLAAAARWALCPSHWPDLSHASHRGCTLAQVSGRTCPRPWCCRFTQPARCRWSEQLRLVGTLGGKRPDSDRASTRRAGG